METFNLEQRVLLNKTHSYSLIGNPPEGTIKGHGYLTRNGKTFPIYLMELDEGFYNDDKSIWISIIAVHHDSVSPIK